MEEFAYILDFIPVSAGGRREPTIYAVGEAEFRLFTLIPRPGAVFGVGDRVYIGKDTSQREVIDHVKNRIKHSELTNNALAELEYTLAAIVKKDEAKYIRFFNEAQSISLRKHLLEELPGLGKKSVEDILREREKSPFTGFEDLTERAKIRSPEKLVARRIAEEIASQDLTRYLFVSK